MFFIPLGIGFFFFLAYARIFYFVPNGLAHVVGGVGWRQFSTTVDIGIVGSMSILTSSTTSAFVGSLKRGVVVLTSIVVS
jgi:hypothetical protein